MSQSFMIPYLNPKIWYAFQGLPIDRVDCSDCLPWSKSLVLTNNLMHILQLTQLTEEFTHFFDKSATQDSKGVKFEEYISFLDKYLRSQNPTIEQTEEKDRNSNPIPLDPETPPEQEKRLRGNTMESHSTINRSINLNNSGKSEADITTFDDYCWTLYRTKNLPQLSSQSTLYNGFFNLWRLFITYSIKRDVTGEIEIPVVMDLVEADYWCGRIKELLGFKRQLSNVEIEENIVSVNYEVLFSMVQNIFKTSCLSVSIGEVALQELADEALDGVTMKGAIKIDHGIRYCVLKSFTLMIYNSKVGANNLRSCLVFNPDTKVLSGTNKIQIKFPGPTFATTVTIEIADLHTINKWHSALSDAIAFSKTNNHNPALTEAKIREDMRRMKREALKTKRLEMEIKLEKEILERCKVTEAMEQQLLLADQKLQTFQQQIEMEMNAKQVLMKENEDFRQESEAHIIVVLEEQQTQYKIQVEKLQEIENEKRCLNEKLLETIEEKSNEEMKRTLLEEKHFEAQQLLLEAEEKINSLEKLGEQLEKALEDERQAKEEEEVVRNATLALLEEEQRSKEKLETLLQQQSNMIDQEIQKRNEFANELENERCRIKNIAEEKEKLTKQLEETRQKMQSTENRVRKLDTKVTQIADNVFGKQETRMPVSHRGKGFIAELVVQSSLKKTTPLQNINDD